MKKPRPTAAQSAQAVVDVAVKEMRDLAFMVMHAIKPKPAEPSTNTEAPPHPLMLNPNEGIWMHYAVGPVEGWFSFGLHGNPPFDTPVQVLMCAKDIGERGFVAIGVRTREIIPGVVKERWEIRSQFPPDGAPRVQMMYWKPLSLPPMAHIKTILPI